MRFLFDNQLSHHLAASIDALARTEGDEVFHLRQKFRPDISDVEWISALAQEGSWVVISGDINITRVRAEKLVWRNAGLIGFFLKKGWMSLQPWDQAWRLAKWWPTITAQARLATPGSTYGLDVNPKGKVGTI